MLSALEAVTCEDKGFLESLSLLGNSVSSLKTALIKNINARFKISCRGYLQKVAGGTPGAHRAEGSLHRPASDSWVAPPGSTAGSFRRAERSVLGK